MKLATGAGTDAGLGPALGSGLALASKAICHSESKAFLGPDQGSRRWFERSKYIASGKHLLIR